MFALLIEFYYSKRQMEQAFHLVENMRGRNIILSPYLDQAMVANIYRANGRAPADERGGGDEDDDDMTAPPTIQRQLTRHVVTRWYRAPELMLYNDGLYGSKIDVWSLGACRVAVWQPCAAMGYLDLISSLVSFPRPGCVLAEMLGMLDNRDADDLAIEREALFPGSSCYPLSGSAGTLHAYT